MEYEIARCVGKIISSLSLSDDRLIIRFADGSGLGLFDDASFCCETRYMRTDDDLSGFVGGRLCDVEIREAPDADNGSDEVHEVQFLVVKTSYGEFVMSSHNEHNGYYGGIFIVARLLD